MKSRAMSDCVEFRMKARCVHVAIQTELERKVMQPVLLLLHGTDYSQGADKMPRNVDVPFALLSFPSPNCTLPFHIT